MEVEGVRREGFIARPIRQVKKILMMMQHTKKKEK